MKILLDTHTFLWWMHDDSRLSPAAVAAIEESSNEILVSSVSAIEIAVKARLGKLRVNLPLPDLFMQGILAIGRCGIAHSHRARRAIG